jgi:Fibronectin type III domain
VVVAVQLFGQANDARTAAPPPVSATSDTPDATGPSSDAATPSSSPSRPPAPADVKLVDNGGSVTLTWTDPSNGQVPFIVAGGRDGTPSAPVQSLEPGHTTTTIFGLRTDANYCYTVAAVWSADTIMASPRTCTHRLSTTPTP